MEPRTYPTWFNTAKDTAATVLRTLGYEDIASSGWGTSDLVTAPKAGIALRLDLTNLTGSTRIAVVSVPKSGLGDSRVAEFFAEFERLVVADGKMSAG